MDNPGQTALRRDAEPSPMLAEWLQSSKFESRQTSDFCLSFANMATDKQEATKSKLSLDKQSEQLDKDLNDFASAKLEDPSHSMLRFQKAVGKFCSAADKESGMDDLSDTFQSLNTRMSIGAEALYNETKAEIARQPGRKELEAAYKKKQDQFFGKMLDLPFSESMRVEDLIKWQDGESKAEHRERIRKGLANNKVMLDAFNEKEAAADKIEDSKSPREKQLEYLSRQIKEDAGLMQEILEKAYIRSTLKN